MTESTEFQNSFKKMIFRNIFLVFLISLSGLSPLAADAVEVLTNASIIKLKQLGLSETVIVQKIKSTSANFDTTVAAIEELNKAGVPDGVIAAMLQSAKPTDATPAVASQTGDPQTAHESGVYSFEVIEGKSKLTKMEPTMYNFESGAIAKALWGGTSDQLAVVQGLTSRREFKERRPVFYFYFEKTTTGLNDAQSAATTPDAFTLGKFEVVPKRSVRRLVIGKMRVYGDSSTGVDAKFIKEFDFEKESPGVFKVTPKKDLPNGEYAFYYAGGQSQAPSLMGAPSPLGKIFDFRINGTPETEPVPVVTPKQNSTSKTKK